MMESWIATCPNFSPNTVADIEVALDALPDDAFTDLCNWLSDIDIFFFDTTRAQATERMLEIAKRVYGFDQDFGCFVAIGNEYDCDDSDAVSVVATILGHIELPKAFTSPTYRDLVDMVADAGLHIGTPFEGEISRLKTVPE